MIIRRARMGSATERIPLLVTAEEKSQIADMV
jgi:hypothetical protein